MPNIEHSRGTGGDVHCRAKCFLSVGGCLPRPPHPFPVPPHPTLLPVAPGSAWRASVRWTTGSRNPDLWSCSLSTALQTSPPWTHSTPAGIHRPLQGLHTGASLLTGGTDSWASCRLKSAQCQLPNLPQAGYCWVRIRAPLVHRWCWGAVTKVRRSAMPFTPLSHQSSPSERMWGRRHTAIPQCSRKESLPTIPAT